MRYIAEERREILVMVIISPLFYPYIPTYKHIVSCIFLLWDLARCLKAVVVAGSALYVMEQQTGVPMGEAARNSHMIERQTVWEVFSALEWHLFRSVASYKWVIFLHLAASSALFFLSKKMIKKLIICADSTKQAEKLRISSTCAVYLVLSNWTRDDIRK